jgi:hypothetical protein
VIAGVVSKQQGVAAGPEHFKFDHFFRLTVGTASHRQTGYVPQRTDTRIPTDYSGLSGAEAQRTNGAEIREFSFPYQESRS